MPQGIITTSFGRLFIVEIDGKTYQAVTKGKKTEYVVGDIVEANISNNEQAQIMSLIPRKNLIYRSDHCRSKIIASNVDLIVIVIAVKPNFNVAFLNACLLACESTNIQPLIAINKADLAESNAFISQINSLYRDTLGYTTITLSATDNCDELLPLVAGKSTLMIGQSGMGKSTITNQLVPDANARIGEITKYETSGSHTTTNATIYKLDSSTNIIDCPGLQEFGLYHLNIEQVAEYFPEMRDFASKCKFANCLHLKEPNCAVKEHIKANPEFNERYAFYTRLVENLKLKKHY